MFGSNGELYLTYNTPTKYAALSFFLISRAESSYKFGKLKLLTLRVRIVTVASE